MEETHINDRCGGHGGGEGYREWVAVTVVSIAAEGGRNRGISRLIE